MLGVFVVRDLREQYAGTSLGVAWAVLQPLLQVAIYWWIFGYVWALKVPGFREGGQELAFATFLLSALLPWLALQDALNKSGTAVLARSDVLRHSHFPVVVFPVAKVLAAHLVFLPLILVFAVASGAVRGEGAALVLSGLIALYLMQVVAVLGVGLFVSSLTVYVRDFPTVLGMGLMGVFFTSPILYPLSQLPEAMRLWIWLNPYTPFAVSYHALLLEGRLPDLAVVAYLSALVAVCCVGGVVMFKRLRPGFADVL